MVVILGQGDAAREERFLKSAEFGSLDLLKSFVDDGVNINARDAEGRTALHIAAQSGAAAEKLHYLVAEAGADVEARDNKGVTPLMLAFENQKTGAARYLLEKAGADPQAKDSEGKGIADRLFDSQKVRADIAGDSLVWLAVKHVDDLQGKTGSDGRNNLHKLASMPDLNNLERLLIAGLDPHQGYKRMILLPNEQNLEQSGTPPHVPLEQILQNQHADDVAKHTLRTFRSLPAVPEQLSELTAETLLKPNEKGHRLLDNPLLWKRMPEVIRALEAKGEPLPSHEQLASGGVMGHSPLSIALHTRNFDSAEHCLAANGENLCAADFGVGNPNKFGEAAIETGLLGKVMTAGKWSGKLHEMRDFYQELPQKVQESVQNYHQLLQQVRATMPHMQVGR